MAALGLALVLVSPLAYADNGNVYDFVFTGSYAPDVPFGGDVPPDTIFIPFTVTFLADSPTLPFPGKGDPFSATLSAYDVNVVIGNQVVLQDGTSISKVTVRSDAHHSRPPCASASAGSPVRRCHSVEDSTSSLDFPTR